MMPFLLAALAAAPSIALQAVGEARAAASGELRYREFHACDAGVNRCSVEYREPDGGLFARKSLDYSGAAHAPALQFEDWRSGERYSVGRSLSPEVVVDAGFDNYVRQRWEALAAGRQVIFPFLPAGRGETVAMVAQREDSGECGSERLCVRVAPDNWLVALVAGSIHLVYDRESRRLLQFRGLSNIRDASGRSQRVVIHYHYPAT